MAQDEADHFALLETTWQDAAADIEASIATIEDESTRAGVEERVLLLKQLLGLRQDAEAAWMCYRMVMMQVRKHVARTAKNPLTRMQSAAALLRAAASAGASVPKGLGKLRRAVSNLSAKSMASSMASRVAALGRASSSRSVTSTASGASAASSAASSGASSPNTSPRDGTSASAAAADGPLKAAALRSLTSGAAGARRRLDSTDSAGSMGSMGSEGSEEGSARGLLGGSTALPDVEEAGGDGEEGGAFNDGVGDDDDDDVDEEEGDDDDVDDEEEDEQDGTAWTRGGSPMTISTGDGDGDATDRDSPQSLGALVPEIKPGMSVLQRLNAVLNARGRTSALSPVHRTPSAPSLSGGTKSQLALESVLELSRNMGRMKRMVRRMMVRRRARKAAQVAAAGTVTTAPQATESNEP